MVNEKLTKDDFKTPQDMYNYYLNNDFFDPCPFLHDLNKWDGLIIDWKYEKIFCNPPYSNITAWIEKAIIEVKKNNCKKVFMLLPAWTDRSWFHDLIYNKYNFHFYRGRLRFEGGKHRPTFRSMLVIIK